MEKYPHYPLAYTLEVKVGSLSLPPIISEFTVTFELRRAGKLARPHSLILLVCVSSIVASSLYGTTSFAQYSSDPEANSTSWNTDVVHMTWKPGLSRRVFLLLFFFFSLFSCEISKWTKVTIPTMKKRLP